ncbi:DUF2804 domain-containing protein [Microbacterium sp. C7(2022)]|uniref:DUF2804 domain-containing protein n=1 Tax=Microbacterium sp. C7(2022) TaxID=2992759 RepID=UPI00237C1B23|nr:DUF2804 domain-containing protein [Microbacterium sp. C7(2022)]MDE0546254.1 DUF2804 domain-containing protein [Microbacterium sp. C7(2022)]
MSAREREITAPVSLTLRGGRLNPAAIGWARHPIIETSGVGRGFGRNKRWEYWNVLTPTHILALTVSSLDYAAVHEVWVFDRETEQTWHRSATVLPSRGVTLAPTLETDSSSARVRELSIDIDEVEGGTRLRGEIPGVQFDIVAHLPAGHERLAVVVPWSSRRFQYTVKDVARPAEGTLTIDGTEHRVSPTDAWAVLDHGRGRWPYDITWNWGAGSGRSHGRVVGVQFGGRWTQGTGSTENAMYIDGTIHKISEELEWHYDLADLMAPWRVIGEGVDATFTPFYNKVTRTNLGVVASSTDQCFGAWSGTFAPEAGEPVAFSQIEGWAEHVHNRW